MWDERYDTDDYVYGTEPNDFLREQVGLIGDPPREVLCLADGEGRNGVYLAKLGHRVLSVDASAIGLRKADRLAEREGVPLETLVADLTEHTFAAVAFDAVVSIFCHVPEAGRPHLHRQVARTLKPGGILILEAYTPAQVPRDTGGPDTPDRTPTAAELEAAFADFEILSSREFDRQVVEGRGHTGLGAVVQFIARKRPA
ncbi:SAM-dependent methyltransferase [Halomonas korlensis]|uniref:Methyltransferase domain-containing protein n=1 Tax=Halomonas korlensis TaxID=463301 RepID=A0A1I7GWF5_9GAMM|nr:class I SAM-dependent methyltransferase [Halomonas korlensis]SFU52778.1 Methyltransferase domain-containing protein [Halomonas korlensis]